MGDRPKCRIAPNHAKRKGNHKKDTQNHAIKMITKPCKAIGNSLILPMSFRRATYFWQQHVCTCLYYVHLRFKRYGPTSMRPPAEASLFTLRGGSANGFAFFTLAWASPRFSTTSNYSGQGLSGSHLIPRENGACAGYMQCSVVDVICTRHLEPCTKYQNG